MEPTSVAARARRALVVDNDSTIRRISQATLERMGFLVESVDSGVEAVVAARAALPDVVVMESQLRDVPAYEAVSWLRSNPELAHVPVVMVAVGDDGSGSIIQDPKVIIRKPLSASRLRQALAEILGGDVAGGDALGKESQGGKDNSGPHSHQGA